jgi:uncharacterized membrane protein
MRATEIAADASVQDYINCVSNGLTGIDKAERQDILAEIRSHLSERIEELQTRGVTDPVRQAIDALGDPKALASQFVVVAHQKHQSRSYTPWVLLRAAARIALTGAKGMLAFVIGVIGYGGALAFFVAAMLKPFNPHIGLWVSSGGVVWGMKSDAVAGHELLGPYFIYASIALSFVFASGCTLLLQRLTRPSKPVLSAVGD